MAICRYAVPRSRLLDEGGLSGLFREVMTTGIARDDDLVCFEQDVPLTYTGRPTDVVADLVALVRPQLWRIVSATPAAAYRRYYLHLTPVGQLRLPQLASSWALFFYFGSVVRYRPHLFDGILRGPYGPFVSEFISAQPRQMLYLLASRSFASEKLPDPRSRERGSTGLTRSRPWQPNAAEGRRRLAERHLRNTGRLLCEVLAQHRLLPLVARAESFAVQNVGRIHHALECQLAHRLKVFDHEGDVTRPDLECSATTIPTLAGIMAETRVEEAGENECATLRRSGRRQSSRRHTRAESARLLLTEADRSLRLEHNPSAALGVDRVPELTPVVRMHARKVDREAVFFCSVSN